MATQLDQPGKKPAQETYSPGKPKCAQAYILYPAKESLSGKTWQSTSVLLFLVTVC